MSAHDPKRTLALRPPVLLLSVCLQGAVEQAQGSRQQNAQRAQRAAIADHLANELAADLVRAGPDHFHRDVEHDRKPDPGDPVVARQAWRCKPTAAP